MAGESNFNGILGNYNEFKGSLEYMKHCNNNNKAKNDKEQKTKIH